MTRKKEDILERFVRDSRSEPGPRTSLSISVVAEGAGYKLKARGGKKAMARLIKALGALDDS